MKYRIFKSWPFYCACMWYEGSWHYILGIAAWTKYGCQKKLLKHINKQKDIDRYTSDDFENIVCEMTI